MVGVPQWQVFPQGVIQRLVNVSSGKMLPDFSNGYFVFGIKDILIVPVRYWLAVMSVNSYSA